MLQSRELNPKGLKYQLAIHLLFLVFILIRHRLIEVSYCAISTFVVYYSQENKGM